MLLPHRLPSEQPLHRGARGLNALGQEGEDEGVGGVRRVDISNADQIRTYCLGVVLLLPQPAAWEA